jgi:hypothetical protein
VAEKYTSNQFRNMDYEAKEFGIMNGGKDFYKFCVRLIMFSPKDKKSFAEYVKVYEGVYNEVKCVGFFLTKSGGFLKEDDLEVQNKDFKVEEGFKMFQEVDIKELLVWLTFKGFIYNTKILVDFC